MYHVVRALYRSGQLDTIYLHLCIHYTELGHYQIDLHHCHFRAIETDHRSPEITSLNLTYTLILSLNNS